MTVTFTTDDECFGAATGITQTVTDDDRPSKTTIDKCRKKIYSDICRAAGTSTDNNNNDLWAMEIQVVSRWIRGVIEGTFIQQVLTDEEKNELAVIFNNMPGGPYSPGKDT